MVKQCSCYIITMYFVLCARICTPSVTTDLKRRFLHHKYACFNSAFLSLRVMSCRILSKVVGKSLYKVATGCACLSTHGLVIFCANLCVFPPPYCFASHVVGSHRNHSYCSVVIHLISHIPYSQKMSIQLLLSI